MNDSCPQPAPSTTVMGADQFDALVETLDVPDEAPALAAAVAQPRRFKPAAETPRS